MRREEDPMSAKRFGIEALIIVILLLALAGVWWYKDHRAEAERAELEADWQARVAAAEAATEEWTEALAAGQAEAVFRAFASGIHPLVLPGRRDTLDQAVAGLLGLPGVEEIHVLDPEGQVLASSDRKLQTTGRLEPRDAWVVETSEQTTRRADREGVVEIAAPIVGPSGPAGFLWLVYDIESARAAARPAGLPA